MVLQVLTDVSEEYSNEYGEIPVLCIDGVDLLAEMKKCALH